MSKLPNPGSITTEINIPADLREINQWIVWAPVLRNGKVAKQPRSWMSPRWDNIDINDRAHWTTFESAVAVMRADTDGLVGIGLVLSGTGVICLDYDDHEGDNPEAVASGREFIADLLDTYPTYAETSVQGKGQHVFYHATLPHGLTNGSLAPVSTVVYSQRFIAITGNVIGWKQPVANGQTVVDSWNLPAPVARHGSLTATEELGRSLVLSDADVIGTMMQRRPVQYRMIASKADLSDRSACYAQIIGDLDKITGDPQQIDRIIRKCPFFTNAFNAERYERTGQWLARHGCESMLEYWLKQARASNTEALPYAEVLTPERRAFLADVMAVFERERIEREIGEKQAHEDNIAALTAERRQAEAIREESTIAHDERSVESTRFLEAINTAVPGNYTALSKPPGTTGEFVSALEMMLGEPRLEYMLPAVISTMSGYLGQTFKLPGTEDGLVNQFILAGQMNSGKTSTITVFNRAIDTALASWYRSAGDPTKVMRFPEAHVPPQQFIRRLFKTRASSVQGLYSLLSSTGAGVWFADEAESQIMVMIDKGNKLGGPIKAFTKESFNASQPREETTLDASRESQRLGLPTIVNLTLPYYWACTAEVFQFIGEKEIVDGTFSRTHLIYDEVPMSKDKQDEVDYAKGLPVKLALIMQRIARVADEVTSAYDIMGLSAKLKGKMDHNQYRQDFAAAKEAGASLCVGVKYSQEARDLKNAFMKVCNEIGHDANPNVGGWAAHYQIMARSETLAMMIASLLAVVDSFAKWCACVPSIDYGETAPNTSWRDSMPAVTVAAAHMQWAIEFTVYWRAVLFDAWDAGKVAVTLNDDEKILVDTIIKKRYATGEWVRDRSLHGNVRTRFDTIGAALRNPQPGIDVFERTMGRLHRQGVIDRSNDPKVTGEAGKAACFKVMHDCGIKWA